MTKKCPRNRFEMGKSWLFGPGKGRVEHDRVFGLGTNAKKGSRAEANGGILVRTRKAKRKFRMKIHEYQAKEILARYGVPVPRGEVANTLEEASTVARKLFAEGTQGVVVKAQIHAGGRGKGGGVKVARTREDAELHAKNILGMKLVTHQTGPQGQKVQRLLIEETAAIDRELYLGIVLDRASGKLVFMASQAGGMEIEEVAAKTPEAIYQRDH